MSSSLAGLVPSCKNYNYTLVNYSQTTKSSPEYTYMQLTSDSDSNTSF